MRILVISFMALGLAIVSSADKLNPPKINVSASAKKYPPPPPVPKDYVPKTGSVKTTTITTKPTTTTIKPTLKQATHKKKVQKPREPTPYKTILPPKPPQRKKKLPPKFATLKKPLVQNKKRPVTTKSRPPQPKIKAERRESSYGAPAAPKRQVIIKQAGPSKQYGWVGHGRYAPLNIPNPFPADLPKWIPMRNNIFEAGLLYPGKPSGNPAPAAPPPPPPQPAYNVESSKIDIVPNPIIPSYDSSESVDSYSAPVEPVYTPPSPQPVYNPKPTSAPIPVPADIPAQPAYQAPAAPSYGSSSLIGSSDPEPAPVTAVPAYTTPAPAAPTTKAPRPSYQQPPISSKPFTVFGNTAQASYNIPEIEAVYEPIGKPGNYPDFNSLPGFAGQTYLEPKTVAPKTVAPTQNTYNAYDVPLKVEETYVTPDDEDQDVYFIFYEDNQEEAPAPAPPAPAAPALQGYISEATPVPPNNNQFKPPDTDDIRTIYVPYENAVNVPDIFDISVGSSFGYSEPAATKSPSVLSSYDNPISSFDAPIYDENSYTAEASSYDANTFSETLWRENAESHVRKARKPAVIDGTVKGVTHFGYQPTSVKFDPSIATSNIPFGSRLSSRTPYEILGL